MWIVIKFDKKKLSFLKNDFNKKLDKNIIFYSPKILIQKFIKNKLVKKDISILGDYILCFHKDFNNPETLNQLKFSRGLKYFLSGFIQYQKQIEEFVNKCRNNEFITMDNYEIMSSSIACDFIADNTCYGVGELKNALEQISVNNIPSKIEPYMKDTLEGVENLHEVFL